MKASSASDCSIPFNQRSQQCTGSQAHTLGLSNFCEDFSIGLLFEDKA